MAVRRKVSISLFAAALFAWAALAACGDTVNITIQDTNDGAAPDGSSAPVPPQPPPPPPASDDSGADACATGTLSGTVYAPNGKLPLPNVTVYAPASTPSPFTPGAGCCAPTTGSPIVTTKTDASGAFTLAGVPAGTNVPLVMQVGKWRRLVHVPMVVACDTTMLTDPDLMRLPTKQSEGDMPHIALVTGGCDSIGCLLPKIGIDASEFGTSADGASKAIHVYKGSGGGGPAAAATADTLWTQATTLEAYDVVLLSCECEEALTNKGGSSTGAPFGAMAQYLAAGGRMITSDFGYTWFKYSSDAALQSVATIPGGAPPMSGALTLETMSSEGMLLGKWMKNQGVGGDVTADNVYANVTSVDPLKGHVWATSTPSPGGPRVFSVEVPVTAPAGMQCGRAIYFDAHVNNTDQVDTTYPASCHTPLKPAEDLMAFFFFDIAGCP